MGVDMNAIVNNEKELRERAMYIVNTYQQPALVETFLPGREFTVGILGRSDAKLYSRHPEWYEKDGFHRFPVLELDSSRSVTPMGIWQRGKVQGCRCRRFTRLFLSRRYRTRTGKETEIPCLARASTALHARCLPHRHPPR